MLCGDMLSFCIYHSDTSLNHDWRVTDTRCEFSKDGQNYSDSVRNAVTDSEAVFSNSPLFVSVSCI